MKVAMPVAIFLVALTWWILREFEKSYRPSWAIQMARTAVVVAVGLLLMLILGTWKS